jgi:hypothetical protein
VSIEPRDLLGTMDDLPERPARPRRSAATAEVQEGDSTADVLHGLAVADPEPLIEALGLEVAGSQGGKVFFKHPDGTSEQGGNVLDGSWQVWSGTIGATDRPVSTADLIGHILGIPFEQVMSQAEGPECPQWLPGRWHEAVRAARASSPIGAAAEAQRAGDEIAALMMAPEPISEGEPDEAPVDLIRAAIEREKDRLRIVQMARRELVAEEAATEIPPCYMAADLLARPLPPVEYRVDGLWPSGGKVLLSAQAKAGKTTLVLNLVRSLLTGEPFLGRFDVEPVERVALLDLELSEAMIQRWLADIDLGPDAARRLVLYPLRGLGRLLDLRAEPVVDLWAERLAPVDLVVVDPIGAALSPLGIEENSSTEVGGWLGGADALMTAAGVEMLMVHHHGHSGDRHRGTAKFLDWPDASWTLTRPKQDDEPEPEPEPDDLEEAFSVRTGQPRLFKAYGRDVEQRCSVVMGAGRRLIGGDATAGGASGAEVDLATEMLLAAGPMGVRVFYAEWASRAKEAGLRSSKPTARRAATAAWTQGRIPIEKAVQAWVPGIS